MVFGEFQAILHARKGSKTHLAKERPKGRLRGSPYFELFEIRSPSRFIDGHNETSNKLRLIWSEP